LRRGSWRFGDRREVDQENSLYLFVIGDEYENRPPHGSPHGPEIYDAMGKENGKRQRAYREYVCSNRDRKEQEIRERMARGVIGAEIFQEKIEKRVMEVRRPKRGRPRK